MDKIVNWILGMTLLLIVTVYFGMYLIIKSEKIIDNELELQNLNVDSIEKTEIYNQSEQLIIETLSGFLEGKKLDVFGSTIYAFIGIPYAEPPVGKLRFSRSVPAKRWTGIRKAHNFTPMCPQIILSTEVTPTNYLSENMSEDCLGINVWTPDIKPKQLKTVMVWIHGGSFSFNSANTLETDGRVLSSFGDVVVVTFNYRVGAFGFLNARTEGVPGNMGIYDQSLALNWIENNIKSFGGDPNKLVPFGQSAGAISIGILMTYYKTKYLFSRAITQSGGFIIPRFSKSYENSFKFAGLVGCLNEEIEENQEDYDSLPDEVVKCLKETSFENLQNVSNGFLSKNLMPFMPTTDGYYEDIESAINYLESVDAFSNIKELMTGLVKDEGTLFPIMLNSELFQNHTYPQIQNLTETRELFIELAHNETDMPKSMISYAAESFIKGPKRDSPLKNIQRLSQALGDFIIVCPTLYLADEMIARNKTVYMYSFNYRPKSSRFDEWMGVIHYEEVPFVFGYPLRKPKQYNKQDIEFSKKIMEIWTHFAKTGEVMSHSDPIWQKYNEENSVMVLNPKKFSVIKRPKSRACNLYKTIVQVSSK